MLAELSDPAIEQVFSRQEIDSLRDVPRHVAIIMDGNRRWGRAQMSKIMDPLLGHWEGARTLFQIVRAAVILGIEQLTLFGFSTENWARPPGEIKTLMAVIEKALNLYQGQMIERGVRLSIIGDLSPFPEPLQVALERSVEATREGTCMGLNLALNYGGRDELKRAIQRIARDSHLGNIDIEALTEDSVGRYLDTAHLPDPDLLIRTSGEMRLSNFLLWQLAYSELYVTPVLWPDFSPHELLKALQHYQGRVRRRGQ